MYHCHTSFYLVGCQPELLQLLREEPAPEQFTRAFFDSEALDTALLRQADVIFLQAPQGRERAALEDAVAAMRPDAQLILLASASQAETLAQGDLSRVRDLWPLPASREQLRFRFRRWQSCYQGEKDLFQANQFLEATINSVPNLVWYKDKNGIHEKVNDSFCATVNKTKDQVEGRGHAYIWDVEQDDPACIESERIVMETKKTCVSEETVQTGAGTRLLTTYKSPLYDLDGSVMGTVGIAIDVTKERAYEQEIVEKNRVMETIFTTMDCGIMCHTLDGSRIISINRAALRILGYESQQELVADGFQMVAGSVVQEDKERLCRDIQTLQRVGDSVSLEYRVRHRDGEILHVMGNVKLIEENGQLFYQRFMLDCTAQKLREQRERMENERRQAELIHALSTDYSLVIFVDLDTGTGTRLQVAEQLQDAVEEIFPPEAGFAQSMERYIARFVCPADQEMMRQASSQEQLSQVLRDKRTCYVNYRVQRGERTEYYQMKAVRTGAWDGRRGAVLGLRSIDEETRGEIEKKNLLEDALLQANRANKAKSVFLSNMSHDIRTPMNAIVGFTALAMSHLEDREKVQEYLKKIMTSGNHLVSLINDILDMSRIESGKIHLEETLCTLPEILHSLRSIVQAEVHAKQLELEIDAVDILHEEIYCDRLRLNQVLLNLLSNSIKYTGAGGSVSLRITEKSGAPQGFACYEFVIRDTGIGMSPEFLTHIFEPFERERNSTLSGIQGTGLGMSITKNIVDLMNGTIDVKSQQGIGTEFTLCLTFRLNTGGGETSAIPALKDCRALVVDDDFNTCDSVSYMLQQFGMRAEWTLSGKEAVLRTRQAITREDRYSVYIIDWLMPDMNGVEVARRIRKEIGSQVPIIILTAYDWSDIEEEAREAGVTAFCGKPLFRSELRRCLSDVVGDGQPAQQEAQPQERRVHTGRILLAEDNELNQEIATAILEEAGFQIDVAENGQVAVEKLCAAAPGYYRLVLMDVQMPVMDGFQATRAIRTLPDRRLAEIPILAMTANAFEEDRQMTLRCGMNGHIAKPIDVEKLIATLEEVLPD